MQSEGVMVFEPLQIDADTFYGVAIPAAPRVGKLVAYCNSIMCYPKAHYTSATCYGAIKEVGRGEDFCPDCSAALFWVRERKHQSRNELIVASKKSRYTLK